MGRLPRILTPSRGVFDLQGLGAVGESAREELSEFLTRLNTQASRQGVSVIVQRETRGA